MANYTNIIIALVIVFAVVFVVAIFFCITKGFDIDKTGSRNHSKARRDSRRRRHNDEESIRSEIAPPHRYYQFPDGRLIRADAVPYPARL